MIQNVLRDIGGIGVYGVISITIFFLFFIGILGWVWRLKRPYLDAMETLPLEKESPPTERGDHDHE
ncbi:MAG: cbb3-type cytochrome c oxidase subunit 3 [Verrucomicrobiota bacterium]